MCITGCRSCENAKKYLPNYIKLLRELDLRNQSAQTELREFKSYFISKFYATGITEERRRK